MLFWLFIGLLAVVALAAMVAPARAAPRKRRPSSPPEPNDENPLDLLDRNAPEALARYGTPEVAEMLEAQGRGDELRGLGYRGGER